MKRIPIPALILTAALALVGPAPTFAYWAIPDVPSLWPMESAFNTPPVGSETSTRNDLSSAEDAADKVPPTTPGADR